MLTESERQKLDGALRGEPLEGETQLPFFIRIVKTLGLENRLTLNSGNASYLIRRAKGLQKQPRAKVNGMTVDIASATDMLLDIRTKAKKGLEEIDFERNRIQERLLILDDTAAKFKKILG